MDKAHIFHVITGHARTVLPDLEQHVFQREEALRDLGANSIDRSEIVMMTLESLGLRVSLVELAGAQNIGELTDLLHDKRALQVG